jgi:hypothetical protein
MAVAIYELHLTPNPSNTALPLCYEVQEPHPQPPPISKIYPFLPPRCGGIEEGAMRGL